jgi:mitochondrial fission protein ELM1
MGRPWAPLGAFDLIVTTPQYFLPPRPNILVNDLPLHRVTAERLQQAAQEWQTAFAHLRRPYTVVLVGGNSGPLVLTRKKARRLGRLVNELAESSGGSALISNSARTPDDAFDAFCREISVPAHIHRWREGTQGNPYFAYLALADQVVVTSESVSMLTEASATGKPLFLFDLSDKAVHGGKGARRGWRSLLHHLRYRSLRHWLTKRFGPRRMHRDIGNIQRLLVDSGRAVWLGQTPPRSIPAVTSWDVQRDAKRAVKRVHQLFGR